MAEQTKLVSQKLTEGAPTSNQTVKFLTAATLGGILLLLSGLTLTVTVICLMVATPVLVIFSPILLPAGTVLVLSATGFLVSGGFGVAAVSALTWMYNYVAGKHPPGSDKIDYARMRLAGKAKEMKDRAKEYGQTVQSKAQEATQGS